jgi:hypothetical protein
MVETTNQTSIPSLFNCSWKPFFGNFSMTIEGEIRDCDHHDPSPASSIQRPPGSSRLWCPIWWLGFWWSSFSSPWIASKQGRASGSWRWSLRWAVWTGKPQRGRGLKCVTSGNDDLRNLEIQHFEIKGSKNLNGNWSGWFCMGALSTSATSRIPLGVWLASLGGSRTLNPHEAFTINHYHTNCI